MERPPGDSRQGDTRRAPRVAAALWVRCSGVDESPVLRRGDVSTTGLYIETTERLGDIGSVQRLHLGSVDGSASVDVLARILRISTVETVGRGTTLGLAFELLPTSPAVQSALDFLVQHVADFRLSSQRTIDHDFRAELADRTERTTVRSLGVHRVIIDTDWQATVGEVFQFDIRSPHTDEPLRLTGQVIQTAAQPADEGGSYRLQVQVTDVGPTSPDSRPFHDVLGHLMSSAPGPLALSARDQFTGSLGRVPLAEVLRLLEAEGSSGELRITRDRGGECTVYAAAGKIVDVDADASDADAKDASARTRLLQALQWSDGEFSFKAGNPGRSDAIGATVSELVD